MFKKAKDLPLVTKIFLFTLISLIFIYLASYIEVNLQLKWIGTALILAWISSVFFGFSTKKQDEKHS